MHNILIVSFVLSVQYNLEFDFIFKVIVRPELIYIALNQS